MKKCSCSLKHLISLVLLMNKSFSFDYKISLVSNKEIRSYALQFYDIFATIQCNVFRYKSEGEITRVQVVDQVQIPFHQLIGKL